MRHGALETAISKGPHASACTLETNSFIRGELRRRIKDGFSILLPAADVMRLFGKKLKLSRIAAVPQAHRCPRLILNLSAQRDSNTLSVNETTDREAAPESLQFGRASPAYCRRYGRRTLSRVRSGCKNWTLQTRTTAAPLNRRRWARLHTSSHWHQGTRAYLYASIWYCRWDGWIPPSFSARFQKR